MICQLWCRSEDLLKIHTKRKHTKKISDPVSCHICSAVFAEKYHLQNHIRRSHKMQKNLKCMYCEKTFKLQRILEVCNINKLSILILIINLRSI